MSTTDLMVKDFATELAICFHQSQNKSKNSDEFEAGRREGLRRAHRLLAQHMAAFDIRADYLGIEKLKLDDLG